MSETGTPSEPIPARLLFAGVAIATLLGASAVALWAYYGTAVFYEMILTGIAACF